MAEERIKQRLRHEKEKARDLLVYEGRQVMYEDNKVICLTAIMAPFFESKIRIVLNKVEQQDEQIMRNLNVLPNQRREIWCREEGKRRFKKIEVMDKGTRVIFDPCQ